ncbi:MAG TPA: hypothetical protein PLV68_09800, partial [Ilumatobacteraceae bacterium]|nr:hypothetical protein [Ilumatobacteraceae bacterium]
TAAPWIVAPGTATAGHGEIDAATGTETDALIGTEIDTEIDAQAEIGADTGADTRADPEADTGDDDDSTVALQRPASDSDETGGTS